MRALVRKAAPTHSDPMKDLTIAEIEATRKAKERADFRAMMSTIVAGETMKADTLKLIDDMRMMTTTAEDRPAMIVDLAAVGMRKMKLHVATKMMILADTWTMINIRRVDDPSILVP